MTDASCGDGCVATLCAFIVPGVRTVVSEELAITLKAFSPVQPRMNW